MKLKKVFAWSHFVLITMIFFAVGVIYINFPFTLSLLYSGGLTFNSLINFIPTTPLMLIIDAVLFIPLKFSLKEIFK